MRKGNIWCFLMAWCMLCTSAASADSLQVATVGAYQGKAVKTEKGGKGSKPLELLMELSEGDTVQVSEKSSVKVVFYQPAHTELLSGPCKVAIAQDRCILQSGAPQCIQSLVKYRGVDALKPLKPSSEKYGGVFMRRAANTFTLLCPLALTSKKQPTFEWTKYRGATEYHLTVEDLDGNVLLDVPVTESSQYPQVRFQYPESVPPLEFGQNYIWKVRALKDAHGLSMSTAAFQVISEDLHKTIQSLIEQTGREVKENPGDSAPYAALLTFYQAKGLVDDALDTCSILIKMMPHDRNLHCQMGRLYELKGMADKAKVEFRKAGIQK